MFIGPSPETIDAVGNKARARELAEQAGVPTSPAAKGIVADEKAACQIAAKIGYPVLIKAAAGGGGRGMRVAHSEIALRSGFAAAKAEASAAFGDDTVYLEKYRRAAAARRGPDPGGLARQHRAPGRARLLGAAPPPEAGRGVAVARA